MACNEIMEEYVKPLLGLDDCRQRSLPESLSKYAETKVTNRDVSNDACGGKRPGNQHPMAVGPMQVQDFGLTDFPFPTKVGSLCPTEPSYIDCCSVQEEQSGRTTLLTPQATVSPKKATILPMKITQPLGSPLQTKTPAQKLAQHAQENQQETDTSMAQTFGGSKLQIL